MIYRSSNCGSAKNSDQKVEFADEIWKKSLFFTKFYEVNYRIRERTTRTRPIAHVSNTTNTMRVRGEAFSYLRKQILFCEYYLRLDSHWPRPCERCNYPLDREKEEPVTSIYSREKIGNSYIATNVSAMAMRRRAPRIIESRSATIKLFITVSWKCEPLLPQIMLSCS